MSLCNPSDLKIQHFSRATLIICPNHLATQWLNEFKIVISELKPLKILYFLTKVQWDKYTYQEVIDADFIITTFNFLGSKYFMGPITVKNI